MNILTNILNKYTGLFKTNISDTDKKGLGISLFSNSNPSYFSLDNSQLKKDKNL